jgi:hypothetical protein
VLKISIQNNDFLKVEEALEYMEIFIKDAMKIRNTKRREYFKQSYLLIFLAGIPIFLFTLLNFAVFFLAYPL